MTSHFCSFGGAKRRVSSSCYMICLEMVFTAVNHYENNIRKPQDLLSNLNLSRFEDKTVDQILDHNCETSQFYNFAKGKQWKHGSEQILPALSISIMNWSSLITLIFVASRRVLTEEDNCFVLFNKCSARHNCLAALLNSRLLCHELLFGESGSGCTQSCREAIKLVDTDKYGKYFLNCNCDRDSECLTHQVRASNCLHNRTMGNKIGCATHSRQCKVDKACDNIMEKFYLKCTHLISGTECTPACEAVQEELYSHNITKGLLTCECSGTVREENFCRGITAHTLHLCKTSPMVKKFKEEQNKLKGWTTGDKRNATKIRLKNVETGCSKSSPLQCNTTIPNTILILITIRQLYEIVNRLSVN